VFLDMALHLGGIKATDNVLNDSHSWLQGTGAVRSLCHCDHFLGHSSTGTLISTVQGQYSCCLPYSWVVSRPLAAC
jgi:hypothetical protein